VPFSRAGVGYLDADPSLAGSDGQVDSQLPCPAGECRMALLASSAAMSSMSSAHEALAKF
jgi:hypothetical protein